MRSYLMFALWLIAACAATALIVRGQPSGRSDAAGVTGRYQIFINENARADTFLLDTHTGRVWVRTEYTDLQGNPGVWKYEDRADTLQELNSLIDKYGTKKDQQP